MSRELPLSVMIAATLTTALNTQPCPESSVYLALGCDIDRWMVVRAFLHDAQLATFAGHSVKLTEKGRVLAEQCDALAAS